jgi:ACS family tartrate transporter-like MFS transporter
MMDDMEADRVFARAGRRLIPFMILLYLVSFLDRVNVGFAALTMNKDLGFTPFIFGWGAGIFFFGYFLFEVPSNLLLEKIGARIWICRIMFTWGLVSAAMALVQGTVSFFALRFLLGVAEAGFFPGMILYLTYWFPAAMRAKFIASFMVAIPLASVVGAPISSLLLGLDGFMGLKGWQWLFILEGLPSCILAFVVLAWLPDGPATAAWLTANEKAIIAERLRRDAAHEPRRMHRDLWSALTDRRVALLSLIYLGIVIGLYGIGLWLPQIVKGMGFTNTQVGFIVAGPYAVSCIAMLAWSRHSDATRERVWHVGVPALLSAAGFIGSALFQSNLLALLSLSVAAVGIYSALAPFWAMPSLFLSGTAAAGGIALINSIGNFGGFLGPYLVGWIRTATGSFAAGMVALGPALIGAAIAALLLGRELALRPGEAAPVVDPVAKT